MYRLPQSVSGTLIIILPLRKSDEDVDGKDGG